MHSAWQRDGGDGLVQGQGLVAGLRRTEREAALVRNDSSLSRGAGDAVADSGQESNSTAPQTRQRIFRPLGVPNRPEFDVLMQQSRK